MVARQEQTIVAQAAHHLLARAKLGEAGEDQFKGMHNLLIGLFDDPTIRTPDQTRRQQLMVGALLHKATSPGVEPQPQEIQFSFTQHAPQAEEEAIIVVARLKDPGAVGDQGPDHRREVEQGIPVGVVTRQTAGFVGQNDPDVAKGDRGDQFVEAGTLAILAGVALVVVNDVDALAGPAEGQCPVNEGNWFSGPARFSRTWRGVDWRT